MNRKFWFGKYSEELIIDICRTDKEYVRWCIQNVRGFKLNPYELAAFIEPKETLSYGQVYEEVDAENTYDMIMNID